jgi:hypothetical protein
MRGSAVGGGSAMTLAMRRLDAPARALVVGWVMVAAGLVAWLVTLRPLHASDLSDIGLISALAPGTWLAIALITVAFTVAVELRPISLPLAIWSMLSMALVLYATPALVEALPRFNTTYVHIGLMEAIVRSGRLFPEFDARYSWPLFFTAGAMISQLARVDLLTIAAWVPLATSLAVLPALWVLTHAFANDHRIALVAMWIFLLADWVGQDYLSPQGMNLVIYVWFLAIVSLVFRRAAQPRPWVTRAMARSRLPMQIFLDAMGRPVGPAIARAGMLLIVVFLAFLSAASHQLTPFAMVGASLGLALVGRTSLRSLPIIVAVITALWVSLAGQDYLLGNLAQLLKDFGDPAGNASTSVAGRVHGSAGHVFVVTERIFYTAAFWGVAALGVYRRIRAGFWDVGAMVLAVVPFTIIIFQSYGGEVFLRSFLLSLPAMCFFAAAAIYPVFYAHSRFQAVALVVLSVGLIAGFMVARYGNERADLVEVGELQGADRAYTVMPQGSLITTVDYNSPIRYRFVDLYDYLELEGRVADLTPTEIARQVELVRDGRPAFLFLTRGQQALEELVGNSAQDWTTMVSELDASPRFEPVFQTADASLYRLVPPTSP